MLLGIVHANGTTQLLHRASMAGSTITGHDSDTDAIVSLPRRGHRGVVLVRDQHGTTGAGKRFLRRRDAARARAPRR